MPWQAKVKPLDDIEAILRIKPKPVARLTRQQKAKLKQLFKAFGDAQIVGLHIGEDEFRAEIMCAEYGADASQLRPLTDNDLTRARSKLQDAGFNAAVLDVRAACDVVAEDRRFDSQADWLEHLLHDGVERCATFLHVYFGAEDNDYTRAVSLYLLTALAGRTQNPGCQADMVPVFCSNQGDGKSTGLAALVRSPELFVEIDIGMRDEDLSRLIIGCVLGELSELRGLGTRDVEHIKSVITRKYEKWIPKYKERARTYPRRIVFVGTTNKREFLADETGERRFLPVDTGKVDVAAIARDRDQLWAEARDLYKTVGIMWQRAEQLGRTVTDSYKVSDSWEPLISSWLDAVRGDQPFTLTEVATGALNIEPRNLTRPIEMRIGKVLNGLGYANKQRRVNGEKGKFWARRGT